MNFIDLTAWLPGPRRSCPVTSSSLKNPDQVRHEAFPNVDRHPRPGSCRLPRERFFATGGSVPRAARCPQELPDLLGKHMSRLLRLNLLLPGPRGRWPEVRACRRAAAGPPARRPGRSAWRTEVDGARRALAWQLRAMDWPGPGFAWRRSERSRANCDPSAPRPHGSDQRDPNAQNEGDLFRQ